MNFSSRYRIRMGCGEPLQSRVLWIAPSQRLVMPGSPSVCTRPAVNLAACGCQRVKCKA